jgi:hypothetical protein
MYVEALSILISYSACLFCLYSAFVQFSLTKTYDIAGTVSGEKMDVLVSDYSPLYKVEEWMF